MTDWNDTTPIYKQIVQHVLDQIMTGQWAAGTQIPSVRTMAAALTVNPLTVAKAYQACVDQGLLEKRRGVGMYVAAEAPAQCLSRQKDMFLQEEWPRIQARIRQLGITLDELAAHSFSLGDHHD